MSRLNKATMLILEQIDPVIFSSLLVWFLSFDPEILSAKQIVWFAT